MRTRPFERLAGRDLRAYGYPVELAAPVAVGPARELADRFDEIRFVFLDDETRGIFERAS